ncbi:unnamed protein product, partial [Effrenium voratum]
DTAIQEYTHIMVYLQSSFCEQSTPQVISVLDAQASASSLAFVDKDLDDSEIGGQITWTEPTYFGPAGQNRVLWYRLYLADDALGVNRELLSYQVKSFSYLRFTATKLRNDTTAEGVQLAEVSFRVGGAWTLDLGAASASNPSGVNPSAEGALGSARIGPEGLGPDMAIDGNSATKWFDYQRGALVVQLSSPALVEAFSFTTANDFEDRDPLQWTLEGSVDGAYWFSLHSQQTDFATPSTRSTGSGWIVFGEDIYSDAVEVGHASADLAPEYTTWGRTTLLVYTESSFVEQTTPNAFAVTDQNSTASDLSFPDLDLDYGELGGTLSWSAPDMTSEIAHYVVYLAEDGLGTTRLFYENVTWTETNLSVPAETNRTDFTYWLVYTASSLVEQTTPAALLIFDRNGTVDAPTFTGKET